MSDRVYTYDPEMNTRLNHALETIQTSPQQFTPEHQQIFQPMDIGYQDRFLQRFKVITRARNTHKRNKHNKPVAAVTKKIGKLECPKQPVPQEMD